MCDRYVSPDERATERTWHVGMVSTRVNDARADDATLIEPLDLSDA